MGITNLLRGYKLNKQINHFKCEIREKVTAVIKFANPVPHCK